VTGIRRALAGCLGALLAAGSAQAQAKQATRLPPASIVRIESAIGAYQAANHVPGLSVALVIDGRPGWSRGFGLADVENAVPATASTAYRSASIGKTMTATAAMRLVEAGRLDLDADIRRYCPAFPVKPWTITVRHLLSHQSGIRHYGGPRDREEQASTVHYADVVDAMAPFKDDALLFQPGTRFGYSTYGYDVLGCVLQGAAGAPFLDVMRTQVWQRAGMRATRDDDPAALVDRRAAGYVLVDGAVRNAPHVDMSNRMPAGGYLTTWMTSRASKPPCSTARSSSPRRCNGCSRRRCWPMARPCRTASAGASNWSRGTTTPGPSMADPVLAPAAWSR
jgi:CubicO group peptidase (beta-lactamase class C family)